MRPACTCPDENQLAAYLESRCGTAERVRLEEHFVDCGTCRQILALSLTLSEPDSGKLKSRVSFHRIIPLRFAIPLSACAAVAIILGIVSFWQKRNELPLQTAELHSVANAPVSTAAPTPAAAQEDRKESAGKPAPRLAERLERSSVAKGSEQTASAPAVDKSAKGRADRIADTAAVPKPQKDEPAIVAETKTEPSRAGQAQDQRAAVGGAVAQQYQQVPLQQREQAPTPVQNRRVAQTQQLAPAAALLNSNAAIAGTLAQSAIARFKLEDAASVSSLPVKRVGEKVFYQWPDYWIDRECANHAEAQVLEAVPGSREYQDIMAKIPELRDLAASNPVLLYWSGKIYLVR